MKLNPTALGAHVLTLQPLTPQQRAKAKLAELRAAVADFPPEAQMMVRIASEGLAEWLALYEQEAEVVLAMYQLQKVAGPDDQQVVQ
ncbi:hypothetical protein [Variovorax sp. GT1P44]|uniref:hypothetical protein n=1 Tax=Variovorax sp. GT1P44 TaxID=3443742 RepID=UPI003F47C803